MTLLGDNPFRRFRYDDLASVPTDPGLYAWYSVIDAGPPDWEETIVDGVDQGVKHSRNVLRSHTTKHSEPALRIDAHDGFSTRWSGTLSDASNDVLRSVLEPDSADAQAPPEGALEPGKLERTLDSPICRKLLFALLLGASPVLASPLYIGVAPNLYKRLHHQVALFNKIATESRKNSEELKSILARPKFKHQFAVRAIERRLTLDNLEVWVLPLQSNELDTDQLRTVTEVAEWLLNRWHRPALGRK